MVLLVEVDLIPSKQEYIVKYTKHYKKLVIFQFCRLWGRERKQVNLFLTIHFFYFLYSFINLSIFLTAKLSYYLLYLIYILYLPPSFLLFPSLYSVESLLPAVRYSKHLKLQIVVNIFILYKLVDLVSWNIYIQ